MVKLNEVAHNADNLRRSKRLSQNSSKIIRNNSSRSVCADDSSQSVCTDDHDLFGEEGAEPILDSFDSYIVVSVLTATASFAALFEANLEDKFLQNRMPILHNVWVFICAICSLSGIYATVVFSLSSTYGRTAVGTGRVHIYETFLESTVDLRLRAFSMYLLSLVLFIILLVFTAVDRVESRFGVPFLGLLLGLSVLIYLDWSTIMRAAAPIFAEEKIQKEHRKDKKRLRQFELKSPVKMIDPLQNIPELEDNKSR